MRISLNNEVIKWQYLAIFFFYVAILRQTTILNNTIEQKPKHISNKYMLFDPNSKLFVLWLYTLTNLLLYPCCSQPGEDKHIQTERTSGLPRLLLPPDWSDTKWKNLFSPNPWRGYLDPHSQYVTFLPFQDITLGCFICYIYYIDWLYSLIIRLAIKKETRLFFWNVFLWI